MQPSGQYQEKGGRGRKEKGPTNVTATPEIRDGEARLAEKLGKGKKIGSDHKETLKLTPRKSKLGFGSISSQMYSQFRC